MLDSNVIEKLAIKLGDADSDVRELAVQALELAKHGEHSDRRYAQTLIQNQTIRVTACWIPMSLRLSSTNWEMPIRMFAY
jgi:hypothetical protein